MKRKSTLTIATAAAVLASLDNTAVEAQDKYSLKSPAASRFSTSGVRGLGGSLFRADR